MTSYCQARGGKHTEPSARAIAIDWIQDSFHERKRRLRTARTHVLPYRGTSGLGVVGRLWLQLQKAMHAGQTWFVLTLIGACVGSSS